MQNFSLFFKRTSLFLATWLFCFAVVAQDATISGIVKDATGETLVGVNVLAGDGKSNDSNTGTVTDIDGKFSLRVPKDKTQLTFSYVGYLAQTVNIDGRTSIDITLEADVISLGEVVVTAFGIQKAEKSLSYAVTEVQGASLIQARENNVINSLAGKIAGVQISRPSTGAGGSSRVVIRGNRSLGGNNQPLYVVDNIPIDNQNINPASRWGGIDYGDGIGDINPDDIESMSVLKGPNAAALYGARAANGVILITTKKGKAQEGVRIDYNGNLTVENPLILPNMQNTYGAGKNGKLITDQAELLRLSTQWNGASWGAEMKGQSALYWDGTTKPYNAQPDNIKNFYQTGTTLTNSIGVSGGNDRANFRFSYANLDNTGVIPTSTLQRNSFTFRGGIELTSKLSLDAKISYIKTNANNRPNLADVMDNPANGLLWMPRNTDINDLKNYADANGDPRNYTSETFVQNPYWSMNQNVNNDEKNRFLGFASLKYKLTDWLTAEGRVGSDMYTSDRFAQVALKTKYRANGQINKDVYTVREDNAYLMLNFNKQINPDFRLSGVLGTQITRQKFQQVGYQGSDLSLPNFYVIQNATTRANNYNLVQKEIQSVFGQVSMEYKNTFFLDVTARNDWSSTLPKGGNSFFYPSVSGSYAFSESLGLPENILTFGKIRASWAMSGNDANAYSLYPTYSFSPSASHLGQPLGTIGSMANQDVPNYAIPLANMKPEQTNSVEFGLDLRFLNDRLGLDLSYYKVNTSNQILQTTVSATSGFPAAVINAGEMENSGIEFLLRGTPVKLDNGFRWDVSFNFARNRNKVLSLTTGLDQLTLAQDRAVAIQAIPGNPYSDIVGVDYKRDANGNKMFDKDGMPMAADNVSVLGNAIPNWIGGLNNTFSYKNFTLGVLIDIRNGGKIFSQSARYMHLNGNSDQTLTGRAEFYAGTGGYVGQGVVETGGANTKAVDPELYWKSVFDKNIISDFVYDAGYIKLREVNLSYRFSDDILKKVPYIKGASISLVGRNLFFFQNGVKGFDPESNFNSGNGQGLESGAIPSYRSYGVNLNLKF
ncbi:MAG: SusC/RagA family TonB-linked outer membrane protein [Bacteroidetes bacterium]|nr:MAG: SusC/RagA family TonB-linked outer membrane protein [Bacteroidota bacterium]